MRYLKLKLINYIGIYNGMGINEIEIDFSKSINDIIMIKGPNGSGKSTIFNALNPFPDSFNNLIQNVPAQKSIDIIDKNIIYKINILYPVNKKGERDTTKAYIEKINTDINESYELNPNGNITSFREIICSELTLDQNYLALSYLSGNNRGLADMKPFERKKYTNSIIHELVDYNDIYKVMSKKSSVYKSMINTIVSKINNIGNKELLISNKESLINKLNKYDIEKDEIINNIANCKASINLLDSTGEYYKEYNNLVNIYNDKNKELSVLENDRNDILNDIQINNDKNIKNLYDIYTDNYNNIINSIQILESNAQFILIEKESKAKKIQSIQLDIDNINISNNDCDLIDINDRIKELESRISSYNNILNNCDYILSINDCESVLVMFENIKNDIYRLRDSYPLNIINLGDSILMTQIYIDNSHTLNRINTLNDNIFEYYRLLEISEPYKLKPDDCSNINCPFIKNAIIAKSKIDNIDINNLIYNRDNLQYMYDQDTEYNYNINKINLYKNEIEVIYRYILQNHIILSKCNINITKSDLCNYIKNGYLFDNEIQIMNKNREISNIKEFKDKDEKSLNDLYLIYNKYKNKIDSIYMYNKMITELSEELNELLSKIDEINIDIAELQNKKSIVYDILQKIKYILSIDNNINELKNSISDLSNRIYNMKNNIDKIKDLTNKSNELTERLNNINNILKPLVKNIDDISRNITLCDEYEDELSKYKDKFNIIEIFKKYSSPNKGIQLIFIELYMNNILTLANNMLSLLFNGEYKLMQFIINENEFRIPCIGSGIMNDDISSMSTSEICMISMILSFSILKQASTDFNILKLDEIDGGLDENNRRIFVSLLYKIKSILEVEQIFIISHNSEIPMDDVDLILLNSNNLNDFNYNSNIIFKN